MSRNEAQTRFDLVDPALESRGWLRTDIRIEVTAAQIDIIDGKPRRRLTGRTDYLLRRPLTKTGEPIPLAIIEAKREGLPPEHSLQQGKDYRVGELNHVPFVFSSNGHQFVEFDESTGQASEAKPMADFPQPEELVARYLAQRQLPTAIPALQILTTGYAQGRENLRYYQDAAVRATVEKIIREKQAGNAPRVLLALATGAGKTRLAAALLRRMLDAGAFGKALFVCDRTELRDNRLGDFQAAFAMVTEDDEPGITSPDYVVMQGIQGRPHPTWFYHCFRSPDGAAFTQSLTRGAVCERLLSNRLASAEIVIPNWQTQLLVAEPLREIKTLRESLEARLAEMDCLPAALLRDAFGQNN